MKKPTVIAIHHKRNTQAALASLNNDLDSKPPSKGDKLFSFTTAKTGKLRRILRDKLDEMVDDQPITAMPKSCLSWPCIQSPKEAKLKKDENDFMVCPLCHGSYGKGLSVYEKSKHWR